MHRLEHAERMEGAVAVGADLHAGADLLEVGRLLVDVDVVAALEQRQRRGEPADAAAGDQDVMLRAHRPAARSARQTFSGVAGMCT